MKYLAALIALMLVAGSLVFWSQWRRPRQTVSGFVEAHEIRVGSRVGGRIQSVLVKEGDSVTAGQTLVELAPYDLRDRYAEAAATLAARRADLEKMKGGYRPEEVAEAKAHVDDLAARLAMLENGQRKQDKEIAQAQVEMAEAALKLAEQNFKRTEEVFKRGQITADEMDLATQQKINAQSQLEVRKQELSLSLEGTRQEEKDEAKAKLAEAQAAWELETHGYRREDIEAAQAAVGAAEAAQGVIKQQLDELTIRAPTHGVIEALDLRPGDLVQADAPVLTLLDDSEFWIRAYIPETKLGLQVGQTVEVTIDSFSGEKFKGRITFVSTTAEFTPRNVQTIEERSKQVFRIKVTLLDGIEKVRSGMIGDVWLDTAK